jgi:hypothetical protein
MDGILIKFGKKEHLEGIAKGELWFSHLSKFREIEEEQSKKGQGDIREGVIAIENIRLKFDGADNHPVYCMTYLTEEFVKRKDGRIEIRIPSDLLESMVDDFAADSMFIVENIKAFTSNLKKSFSEKLKYDCVIYEEAKHRMIRLISDDALREIGIKKENIRIEFRSLRFQNVDNGETYLEHDLRNLTKIPDSISKLSNENLVSKANAPMSRNIGKSNVEELHFTKELIFKSQREFRIVDFGRVIDEPQILRLKSGVDGSMKKISKYKNRYLINF